MIRKSVQRFSERIMLKKQTKARWRFPSHRALERSRPRWNQNRWCCV